MTKIKKIILTKNLHIYSVFHAWVSFGHINSVAVTIALSFEANFSFFSLADSPPHDLQITAYK